MNELKIGDELFVKSRFRGICKVNILRETKTQYQLSNNSKLKKPFKNGTRAIGSSGYGAETYYIKDEQIQDEYDRSVYLVYISRFPFSDQSTERLKNVVKTLQSIIK